MCNRDRTPKKSCLSEVWHQKRLVYLIIKAVKVTTMGKQKATRVNGTLKKEEEAIDDGSLKKEEQAIDDEEYDEDEDEDYDPEAKVEEEKEASDEESDHEPQPDYSSIENATFQDRLVKTRSQRHQEKYGSNAGINHIRPGLIKSDDISQNIDVDAIFNDLQRKSKSGTPDDWKASIEEEQAQNESIKNNNANAKHATNISSADTPQEDNSLNPQKVKIESSYTFAGKVITESKLVDADSAEAKAYFNSTKGITASNLKASAATRSFVPIIRTIPGSTEPTELRIKLKRPSLIDKFLSTYGDKKQKLSTLEKSRLDWASFVDKKKLKDDLSTHNKGGYLDKQEFLGRLQDKRDEHYQKAKEEERKRQWQLQQQQSL